MRILKIVTIVSIMLSSAPAWAREARRIVSLKPAVTDTVYALGMGERLVGVTRYCDVPEGSARPDIAADYTRPYTERIIALRPDLVIGSEENSSRRSIESLRRAGIDVRLFPFTSLDESFASINGIAELFGRPDRGRMLTADIRSRMAALRRRRGEGAPLKAVVVWGLRPMIAAGVGTYMDQAMPFIGLENAVARSRIKYPKIGLEQLIAYDPDVIIDLSMDVKPGGEAQRPWSRVTAIKAVRDGRVIHMDPSLFRAGPGIASALEKLAKEIYGKY